VLYARVSKLSAADRARGDAKSVEQQLALLRALAEREGVQVVAVHRDDGVSASAFARRKAREGWQDVMGLIVSGAVSELWLWEQSRSTRDRPVYAALMAACEAQDVKISLDGRLLDPSDPDDAFHLDLGNALAVRESAMTAKRLRRDVAARAAQGLPAGRIPYGYRRAYDDYTHAVTAQEPCPVTGPIVRELARRALAGEALYRLAADMTERGVPSPETWRHRRQGDTEFWRPWRPDHVRDVVLSPSAAGLRVHRAGKPDETIVPGQWAALIATDEHVALKAKLTDPTRRTWTDASAKHLLTGLAVCGECGGEVRRISNRGTPSYACVGRRHGPPSDGRRFCVARRIDLVDRFVTDVIVARLSSPDVLDVWAADPADDVQAAQQEVVALNAELAELREAKKDRRISLRSFLEFEPDLLSRLSEAERRAQPVAVPPLVVELAGPEAAARWERLELEQKRAVIRLLCTVRITRRPESQRGMRTFDPTLIKIEWRRAA
jgi:DNA invertase Pin-like site-specific DNA recombinase